MNISLREIEQDSNGRWCVCWDGPRDYIRLRLTRWQAIRWALVVKLRHMLHLPTFPVWVPDGAVVESGPALLPRS